MPSVPNRLSFALCACLAAALCGVACRRSVRPASESDAGAAPLPAASADAGASTADRPAPGSIRALSDQDWVRAAELPTQCAVHLARDPGRVVEPLAFEPCSDGPEGCRSFVSRWTSEGNSIFGRAEAIVPVGSKTFFVSKRQEYDANLHVKRVLHVVEQVDGASVFALAVDKAHTTDCAVEIAAGSQGIAITAFADREEGNWLWIGTSSWERPLEVKWTKIVFDARQATQPGYSAPSGYSAAGVWLGDERRFSLYRAGATTLLSPTLSELDMGLDSALVSGEGAWTVLFRFSQSVAGAIGYVDRQARLHLVRKAPSGESISHLAVDRSRGGALVWLQGGQAEESVLFSADKPAAPAELKPRQVTTLPFRWSSVTSLVADRGSVALLVGSDANIPAEAHMVRADTGVRWKLPALRDRWWTRIAGFTETELWIWTSTPSKVGSSGIVRFRLDAIAAPSSLPLSPRP
ncbi:MAG: hypothetical protein HY898_28640 [Deltaproteobacteria bacterium]|nr:hypothetical protein [Deltaproteobacteria bacterium]